MSEEDAELLERSEAIASDSSPEGQSSVTQAAEVCTNPKVTVGLFFDGTFNNAFNVADYRDDDGNVGGSEYDDATYTGSYTNVRRLWDLHFDMESNDHGAGQTYARRYIEGIGSRTGGPYSTLGGGATAGGETGIATQIQRGTTALREAIQFYGRIGDLPEITVNCFGFSRGAATARVFCNMLADAAIPNLKIGFLGLFDTVGSVGIPGNNVQRELGDELATFYCNTVGMLNPACYFREEGPVYDLNIKGSTAETVLNIVAGDEFRVMYPSASVLPSHATEVWMPGAHGDIGGAEADGVVTETYGSRPSFLERRGWFDEAERVLVRESSGRNPAVFNTIKTVQPNIGTASLHAMHFHAQRARVPLRPLEAMSPLYRKPMSTLLGQAASVMEAGASVPQNLARSIRARYVHKSFGGIGPDTRLMFTERRRYPNQG